jgi:uncharacterized membrane protein YiaA
MKIHYGVIVAWLGSVGVYELAKHLTNYGIATVATVVVLFGAIWLEDRYSS